MQIPPSTTVLRAFSQAATAQDPTAKNMARVTPSGANVAAREAARAVFAQLKAPPSAAPVPATPLTAPTAISGTRPLPRGSIVNLLV